MKYWKYAVIVMVLSALLIAGCSNEVELTQQEKLIYEGEVIAVAPVVTGSVTNTYIGGVIIYFRDGSKVKVKGDIVLILGGYYIITTAPPVNEYWEYLEIVSITYRPREQR